MVRLHNLYMKKTIRKTMESTIITVLDKIPL